MNRKTLIAGLVFAGLVLATVLLLRSPEKGTRTPATAARPIPSLSAGSFDTLEVTKNKVTTVIKKDGDTYKIVRPNAFPADKDAAKLAFESLAKLEFGDVVSDQKARHGELELGDDSLRVVVKQGDKVVADLHIGKTANQMTMVRLEGKDEVWSTSGLFKYQLDKDTTGWRDKSITAFDEKDVDRLQVAGKSGAKIVLSKPAPSDAGPAPEWRVVESTVKVEPFDKSVASGVVSQLATWKANDFADGAKLKRPASLHQSLPSRSASGPASSRRCWWARRRVTMSSTSRARTARRSSWSRSTASSASTSAPSSFATRPSAVSRATS